MKPQPILVKGAYETAVHDELNHALETGEHRATPNRVQVECAEREWHRLVRAADDAPATRGHPFGSMNRLWVPHGRYGHLRLRADAAEGMTYARARDVQSSNPHQVVVPLDDRAALEEALALLRKAYDQAI